MQVKTQGNTRVKYPKISEKNNYRFKVKHAKRLKRGKREWPNSGCFLVLHLFTYDNQLKNIEVIEISSLSISSK